MVFLSKTTDLFEIYLICILLNITWSYKILNINLIWATNILDMFFSFKELFSGCNFIVILNFYQFGVLNIGQKRNLNQGLLWKISKIFFTVFKRCNTLLFLIKVFFVINFLSLIHTFQPAWQQKLIYTFFECHFLLKTTKVSTKYLYLKSWN